MHSPGSLLGELERFEGTDVLGRTDDGKYYVGNAVVILSHDLAEETGDDDGVIAKCTTSKCSQDDGVDAFQDGGLKHDTNAVLGDFEAMGVEGLALGFVSGEGWVKGSHAVNVIVKVEGAKGADGDDVLRNLLFGVEGVEIRTVAHYVNV